MKNNNIDAMNVRLMVAISLGTAIEWYDFFLYALVAPLAFDVVFFPKLDPVVAMLVVFSSFTVGFIARPLGGIVFGHFGDRFGRKIVFVTTLVTMGISSTAIGLLPGYATIGVIAPILLVTLRFLQGFAIGGESTGALVLMVESVPGDRRGLYAALIQAAGPVSIIAASAIVAALTAKGLVGFRAGLWRIPFLVSAVLLVIGAYIRRNVNLPSDQFQSNISAKVPIAVIFKSWKRPTVISFLVCLAETAFFYLTTIFAIAYGSRILGLSQSRLTSAFLVANCIAAVTVPVFGMLSDRIGRRPLLLAGLLGATCFIYPFFRLLQTGDLQLAGAAIIISAGIIHPIMFSAEGSFVAELFDTQVRYTGTSLGKQVGTVLGGGLAPVVATALVVQNGTRFLPIVVYFLAMAIPSIIAAALARETAPAFLPAMAPDLASRQ